MSALPCSTDSVTAGAPAGGVVTGGMGAPSAVPTPSPSHVATAHVIHTYLAIVSLRSICIILSNVLVDPAPPHLSIRGPV